MTHIRGLESRNYSWSTPELAPEVVGACPLIDVGLRNTFCGHFLPATHVRDPITTQVWRYGLP